MNGGHSVAGTRSECERAIAEVETVLRELLLVQPRTSPQSLHWNRRTSGSSGPSWGMLRTTTIEPPQRSQGREGVAVPSRAAASAATLDLSFAILSFTSSL